MQKYSIFSHPTYLDIDNTNDEDGVSLGSTSARFRDVMTFEQHALTICSIIVVLLGLGVVQHRNYLRNVFSNRTLILDEEAHSVPRRHVAVCAAVRDTPENVDEWVRYHHDEIGVSTFYLMVTDDPYVNILEDALGPWIQRGVVELYPLPYVNPRTVPQMQVTLYEACLDEVRDQHDFIGFWDVDEFVTPVAARNNGSRFVTFLMDNMMDVGGLALNWRIVGPSGHMTKPDGGILANYKLCTPWDYHENEEIKSIVNTKYAVKPLSDPHTFEYQEGYYAVDCLKQRVHGGRHPKGIDNNPPLYALYHYVTKSWDEYREKMRRGSAMGNRKTEAYFKHIQDIGQVPCDV